MVGLVNLLWFFCRSLLGIEGHDPLEETCRIWTRCRDDALPDDEDALDDAEYRPRELEQKHSSRGGPGLDARGNQEFNRLKTRQRIEERANKELPGGAGRLWK